jgi:hypothetical protein
MRPAVEAGLMLLDKVTNPYMQPLLKRRGMVTAGLLYNRKSPERPDPVRSP